MPSVGLMGASSVLVYFIRICLFIVKALKLFFLGMTGLIILLISSNGRDCLVEKSVKFLILLLILNYDCKISASLQSTVLVEFIAIGSLDAR